jgi:hypothetical protein
MALAIISCVGYEHRRQIRIPSFWVALRGLALLQAAFLVWLFMNGFTLSVFLWVLLAAAEFSGFYFVYRLLVAKPRG